MPVDSHAVEVILRNSIIKALPSRHPVGIIASAVVGKKEYWASCGRSSATDDTTPSIDTLFEIGSVTQLFTSLCLAVLHEKKVLSQEDPVQNFLPSSSSLTFRDEPIQLQHLATHTSGLPRVPPGFPRATRNTRENPYSVYTDEEVEKALSLVKLRVRPGRHYSFSMFGAGLLGQALTSHTDSEYESLLQSCISDPLDLKNTRFTLSPSQHKKLALGHSSRGKPVPEWQFASLAGAGGLHSTAEDLLIFLNAHTGRIRTRQSDLSHAMSHTKKMRAQITRRRQIGLGWHIEAPHKGIPEILWHNGGTGGHRCFVAFVEATKTAVVILANSNQSLDRLGFQLIRTFHTIALP